MFGVAQVLVRVQFHLQFPQILTKNVPAHVGHAMNNPVAAPMVLVLRSFLDKAYALTAIDVFSPTRYETTTCNTRFMGIICNPICSVRYMINFGMYPGPSQHGAMNPEGIVAP